MNPSLKISDYDRQNNISDFPKINYKRKLRMFYVFDVVCDPHKKLSSLPA